MGFILNFVASLFLGPLLPLLAQGGLIARPPAAPDYTLGPGDQISIHVVDMDEISDKPQRIDPNGYVDIPMAGRIRASGLSLEQFKAEVSSRLTKYITSPDISVSLTDDQSRVVSVIGSVTSPGVHQLPGPERLIEVISLAGGARTDAGARVIVTREQKWGKIPLPDATVDVATGNSVASVSLDDLQSSKNPIENILVMPDDIISVPKAETVYVMGNVKKSGAFQLSSHPTITLLQALTLAEGPDHDASLKKAEILRPRPGMDGDPIQIPVNITDILDGKARDIALQGNDILWVPNSAAKGATRRTIDAVLQAATGVADYHF